MYACVCMCLHVFMCLHVCLYLCRYVGVHACMYVCMCVRMHVCMCVNACLPACLRICLCFWMYVCMYVCMYVRACVRFGNRLHGRTRCMQPIIAKHKAHVMSRLVDGQRCTAILRARHCVRGYMRAYIDWVLRRVLSLIHWPGSTPNL